MKVSTKGRYALRMMVELALVEESRYTPLKEISKHQNISVKYLEQITGLLSKAGMIKSMRGANGGYMLTRRPEQYLAGDIIRVTEGSLAPIACLECEANVCNNIDTCTTIEFWEGLAAVIDKYVDGVTLEDLANNYKNKTEGNYII